MIENWVFLGNLKPLVEILSTLAGYEFDEGDWAAISFGVGNTDNEAGRSFEYSLIGTSRIDLWLAKEEDPGILFMKATSDLETERSIPLIVSVLQEYRLEPWR